MFKKRQFIILFLITLPSAFALESEIVGTAIGIAAIVGAAAFFFGFHEHRHSVIPATERLGANIGIIQSELRHTSDELSRLSQSSQSDKKTITELETRIGDLGRNLEEAQRKGLADKQELEKKFAVLEESFKKLSAQDVERKAQIEQIQDELRRLDAAIKAAEDAAKKAQEESAALKTANEALAKKIGEQDAKMSAKCAELEAKLAAQEARIKAELEAKVAEVKKQLEDALNAVQEKLEQERTTRERQVQALKEELAKLQVIGSTKEELEKVKAQLQKLSETVVKHEQLIEELRKLAKAAQATIDGLTGKVEDLEKIIAQLQKQYEELAKGVKEKQETVSATELNIDKIRVALQRIVVAVQVFERETSAGGITHEAMFNAINELQAGLRVASPLINQQEETKQKIVSSKEKETKKKDTLELFDEITKKFDELNNDLKLTKQAFNTAFDANFAEPQSRNLKAAARSFKKFMPQFQVIGNTASIVSEREALLKKSAKLSIIP